MTSTQPTPHFPAMAKLSWQTLGVRLVLHRCTCRLTCCTWRAVCTPQSALHSLHSTVYTPQSTLHSLHSTVCTPQSTLVQTVPRCALYGCRYSLNHVVLSPMNSTAGEHIYTFDVDQHQAPVSFCMRSSQSSPTSHAATATNAAATFAPASLASLAANRAGVTKDADTVPPKRVLPSLSAWSMKLKEQGNHHCAGKRWFQVIHSLPKRIA